ncbi:N-acetylmuramoyl-L-alanine amidase [Romboutsia lituseburensis]|uniref:N-acetylmuramoyl-L-alanine amidase n=1 Tax=Romboutsia lituseburensis TaxID=1537 RepID=UPI000AB27D2A|nr:N-acetylmuramoyl-L-alanine amidase [Romboutsia lituseburensis]CEH35571.1 Cell wall hydrolase/autolysin [Romboutsia lituseburensis]
MKKILKKLSIMYMFILLFFASTTVNALAYHNEDEEQLQTDALVEKLEQQIKNQKTKAQAYSKSGFTVVIDAGHGGKDSGAANDELGFEEKWLNLDIARAIEKRLKDKGVNVVMTRNSDVFVELAQRAAIANGLGADLFVSVHNDTQTGNGDGSHIIHSVTDNNGGMSKTLATNIGNSIKNNTSQNLRKYNPVWSRYSSNGTSDYYAVIRQTKMPAVIVEHAYMNANDIKAVDTPEKRRIMGTAVADGIYNTIQNNFGGWMKYKGTWRYYNPQDKTKAVGWELINGLWYYFDENGTMQTGWKRINNIWYYLDNSGAMQRGWKKISNIWYYFDGSGSMKTGWQYINSKWYYLDSTGAMKTGWQYIKNTWYYLDSDGAMHIGWKLINNTWYYMDNTGAMKTGWLTLANKKYYLREDGSMVIGSATIDNKTYIFNQNGELI